MLIKVFDKGHSTGYTELKINQKTRELFKLSHRPQGSAKREKNNVLPIENRPNRDCGCSENVERKWKARLDNPGSVNWDKAATLLQRARVFNEICYEHLANLAGKFKLRDMKSRRDLREALDLIYKQQRNAWELKTDPSTYSLFPLGLKPAQPVPISGIAQFPTLKQPPFEPAMDQLQESLAPKKSRLLETRGSKGRCFVCMVVGKGREWVPRGDNRGSHGKQICHALTPSSTYPKGLAELYEQMPCHFGPAVEL